MTKTTTQLPVASPRFGNGTDPVAAGRLGGIRSGQVRREQGKSVRDRLREKVEEEFDQVWSAFQAGLSAEDERTRFSAAVAVLAEAYGRPQQAIVGDVDKPVRFVIQSAFADDGMDALEEGSEEPCL
jgi:hypothetical protein